MPTRLRFFGLAVAALSLVASACSPGSRQTELPSISEEIEGFSAESEALICQVGTGTGRGAEIISLNPQAPAAGVLAEGDVITRLGDEAVVNASDLIAAVRDRTVGESLETVVLREGEETTVDVTIGENPDVPGVPLLGASVTTVVNMSRLRDLPSDPLDGPFARVMSMEGSLLVVDALQGAWQLLEVTEPESPWSAFNDEIYALEAPPGDAPPSLRSVRAGTRVELDVGEWSLRWLLGGIGASLLLVGERTTDDVDEPAVLAVDPETGAIQWEWVPNLIDAETGLAAFPVLGFTNPVGNRILIASATPGDVNRFDYVVLDPTGRELTEWPPRSDPALPEGAVALGWYSESSILYIDQTGQNLLARDPALGESNEVLLPTTAAPERMWPVGNGRHLILQTSGGTQFVSTFGELEIRPLTERCVPTLVTDPPWRF